VIKAAAALLFLVTTMASAPTDAPDPIAYKQAVEETYSLVQAAAPNDSVAAQQAIDTLEAGTGLSQPEIITDLKRRPPDFEDAKSRLATLIAALSSPAAASDPVAAHQTLHDILAMQRFDALHQPPTLLDRISQWIGDRVRDFLRFVFGGNGTGASLPILFFYAVGTIVVIGVAVIMFRSARGRFTAGVESRYATGPRAPADYFAAADRLASEGDRVGAIRLLCAGVAATLAGERTWEGSPLTVREIFQRAPDPARLRPLLVPFEGAVYGGRDVDAATYARAEAAAAPFRQPSSTAVAA
jgi:hypothetical protein